MNNGTKSNPDPQPPTPTPLEQAVEEIKAVIHKHNLAALVTIQSQTQLATIREVSPTWSCAHLAEGAIHLRAHLSDFADKEAQKAFIAQTLGMLQGFQQVAALDAATLRGLFQTVQRSFDIQAYLRGE